MATGPQLRIARVARGLKLWEVAQRAYMGVSTLSRVESGLIPLRPEVEARLKEIVEWTPAFDALFAALDPPSESDAVEGDAPVESDTPVEGDAPDEDDAPATDEPATPGEAPS